MNPSTDDMPPPGAGNPERLQRRVRLMAVLGILLTSTVIGGIGTYLLYKSQAATLTNQLFFAIELQAATMEGELARLTNIAAQIASRTRIRQELERYQHGEIDKATLVGFTVPKLTDAMQSNADVVGITRLTDERIPVIEVGRPIDPSLWPHEIQDSETVVGLPRDGFIVVSAPIRNRKQQTVGTDLVMFRDDRLNQVMQGFFTHIETVGSVQIATLERGLAMHFYDVGEMQPTLPDEALKIELMEMFQLGVDDGMHRPSSGGHSHLVVAHRQIGQSGWAFLYYADPWDFYADARTHALFAVFTVFALAMLGIALTNRVIQPLVSRVAVETRNLQRLLQHNEELLTAVQTNEAKLQAVIDYAPAIIYIKDHAGRYLLVNSSYEKLVDLPREQIVGKFDYELFPDDIAKSTRDTDLEVLATGKPITIDEKAPQRDGIHDFLSIKFPLLDATGEVSSVCGISTDITERKTVERRLAGALARDLPPRPSALRDPAGPG